MLVRSVRVREPENPQPNAGFRPKTRVRKNHYEKKTSVHIVPLWYLLSVQVGGAIWTDVFVPASGPNRGKSDL